MLSSVDLCYGLYGLGVSEVGGLYSDTLRISSRTRPETSLLKLLHTMRQISWGVKRRCADININHELLVRRAHGGVESSPCFKASTKRKGRVLW